MKIDFGRLDRALYPLDGFIMKSNGEQVPISYRISREVGVTVNFTNKMEQLQYSGQIVVYGEYKFAKNDVIKLHNGALLQVDAWTPVYLHRNIQVRHLLKPKVKEILVDLK